MINKEGLYTGSVFLASYGIDEDDADGFRTYEICGTIIEVKRPVYKHTGTTVDVTTVPEKLLKIKYYYGIRPFVQTVRLSEIKNLSNDMVKVIEFLGREDVYDIDTDQLLKP